MNSADTLRFNISDRPRFALETYLGDGTSVLFQVSANPIITGATALGGQSPQVMIRNANGDAWSATSLTATSLIHGTVTFAAPIPFGVPFQIQYTYASFSDAEMDLITASAIGDAFGQKLNCIDQLLTDYVKRARWAANGVSYDDSVVFQNLLKLREQLWKQMTEQLGPQGGIASWASEQQNYG